MVRKVGCPSRAKSNNHKKEAKEIQKMNYRPRLVLFLWAMAGSASATRAQDFYWNTAGSRSQALGGVYVASSSDVIGALAANPAGLTELRSRNLNLETDAVF